MEDERTAQVLKSARQMCEMADTACFAHGHHCLQRAAAILLSASKAMERGTPPVAMEISQAIAAAKGYIMQYDSWLTAYALGRVRSEPEGYDQVLAMLKPVLDTQTAVTTNGSKS